MTLALDLLNDSGLQMSRVDPQGEEITQHTLCLRWQRKKLKSKCGGNKQQQQNDCNNNKLQAAMSNWSGRYPLWIAFICAAKSVCISGSRREYFDLISAALWSAALTVSWRERWNCLRDMWLVSRMTADDCLSPRLSSLISSGAARESASRGRCPSGARW